MVVELGMIVFEASFLLGPHSYLYGLFKIWKGIHKKLSYTYPKQKCVMTYSYVNISSAARE